MNTQQRQELLRHLFGMDEPQIRNALAAGRELVASLAYMRRDNERLLDERQKDVDKAVKKALQEQQWRVEHLENVVAWHKRSADDAKKEAERVHRALAGVERKLAAAWAKYRRARMRAWRARMGASKAERRAENPTNTPSATATIALSDPGGRPIGIDDLQDFVPWSE